MVGGRGACSRGRRRAPAGPAAGVVEALERRALLSASAADAVVTPLLAIKPGATFGTTIDGYTPAQIKKAYGIDQISFNGVTGDGSGQTIAIVDAYNDPNIVADLAVFSNQFNLPAADLKVVNQSGGSNLPPTDPGWAGEIALDVEWAHAIAPAAKILLVEANTATIANMMSAVDYARKQPGVSVVSMSWGGSEFFGPGQGESKSQKDYDPKLTTPAGHQGVTFVAAAGDEGSASGFIDWPASSPSVLAVGGTNLVLADDAGAYGSESSWFDPSGGGTTGGASVVEKEPAYQQAVQNTGARTTADVSYDGDPNSGFAVYNSIPDGGFSGWQVIGGTSAGTPQWAALVAIANQGRALNGLGSLSGASETLPALYGLYSATDASGNSTYGSYFNDVIDTTSGSEFPRLRRAVNPNPAAAGYDTATGLGTPKADAVVAALAGTAANGSTTPGGSSNGGGGGGGPTPQQILPASTLVGAFKNAPPLSVAAGKAGTLKLVVRNTDAAKFKGPVSVALVASSDASASDDDTPLESLAVANLKLAAGASKTLTLKFAYPAGLSGGSYYLVASVSAAGANTQPSQAVAANQVFIAAKSAKAATATAAAAVFSDSGTIAYRAASPTAAFVPSALRSTSSDDSANQTPFSDDSPVSTELV